MKTKVYNRQTEINSYLKKFKIPFEMKDDAIDLRTMSDNYDRGIIPLNDIAEAIDVAREGAYTDAEVDGEDRP